MPKLSSCQFFRLEPSVLRHLVGASNVGRFERGGACGSTLSWSRACCQGAQHDAEVGVAAPVAGLDRLPTTSKNAATTLDPAQPPAQRVLRAADQLPGPASPMPTWQTSLRPESGSSQIKGERKRRPAARVLAPLRARPAQQSSRGNRASSSMQSACALLQRWRQCFASTAHPRRLA